MNDGTIPPILESYVQNAYTYTHVLNTHAHTQYQGKNMHGTDLTCTATLDETDSNMNFLLIVKKNKTNWSTFIRYRHRCYAS